MPLYNEILIPPTLHGDSLRDLDLALQKSMGENPNMLLLRAETVSAYTDASFCLGLDIGWATTVDSTMLLEGLSAFCRILNRIETFPGISICHVDGHAKGGGLGLAACCDILLASETATFQLSEGLFGLIPGVILPSLRSRVSDHTIKKWVLTSQLLDAQSAKNAGLVDDVVSEIAPWITQLKRCHHASVRDLKDSLTTSTCDVESARLKGADLLMSAIQDPDRRTQLVRIAKATAEWW